MKNVKSSALSYYSYIKTISVTIKFGACDMLKRRAYWRLSIAGKSFSVPYMIYFSG